MAKEIAEKKIASVDEYIRLQRPEVRPVLKEFRALIQKALPDAREVIAWGMPTYKLNGGIAHFAAFKNHCSIFLNPKILDNFRDGIKQTTTKSCVHFPLDEPLPASLITRIVKYAAEEDKKKAASKTK